MSRGYRAEVVENHVVDNVKVIRSHPTCQQCQKLQAEIKRLKKIVEEHNLGPVIMKPRNWRDSWASTPDKVSTQRNDAFSQRHTYSNESEVQRMRKEISRLQNEVQVRSDEIQELRGQGQPPIRPNVRASRQNARSNADQSSVGEMYSALYLQEWKTSFSSLSSAGMKQDDIVTALLNLLKTNHRDTPQSKTRTEKDVRSMAAEYQRRIQDLNMPNIQKNLSNKVVSILPPASPAKNNATVTTYINRCIQVCWAMCIADEAVTLDNSLTRFAPLDPERYRNFAGEEGQYVEYVIWPAAVTDDGKLQAQGVVQATERSQ